MENFSLNNQERFLIKSAVPSIGARNKNHWHGLFMFAERYIRGGPKVGIQYIVYSTVLMFFSQILTFS
jgi:hypothetical protein